MRFLIVLFLIAGGTLIAALYGAIHDQVTFSISPEFFTKVRFVQMEIDPEEGRWGAFQVGFFNTWKIGFLISIILTCVGLIHQNNPRIIRYTLQSFFISMNVAAVIAILGVLVGASSHVSAMDKLPETIIDQENFLYVQTIHNFSYIGGLVGMFIGVYWQFHKRKKDHKIISRQEDF